MESPNGKYPLLSRSAIKDTPTQRFKTPPLNHPAVLFKEPIFKAFIPVVME